MSHPSKKKGSAFERDVADYLVGQGHVHAERAASRGKDDRGDITGIPGWIVECKNEARIDLAGYMNEVERERRHAGAEFGVAVVKRRTKHVARSYVVLDLESFSQLLRLVT